MKKISMTLLLLMVMIANMSADVKVVFAGDGVTDGAWGRSKGAATPTSNRNSGDLNHHLGDSYVFQCAAWYQSQYPTLGIDIKNRGIIGNTLSDLSSRWQADVLDLNPNVISVLIGAKDVDNYISSGASESFDVDTWTATYRAMLTAARTANANVKLVLCAPFAGSLASSYSQRSTLLGQLATAIQGLATEFSATYVAFDDLFKSEPSEGYYLWDGTMPTPAGNYMMFKKWVECADGLVIGNTTPATIGPSVTKESQGKRRVLYIGDSITDAGWGLAGGSALSTNQRNLENQTHIMGHGYAMLCASWYLNAYNSVGYEIMNRGISGNTLADLASRWQSDVLALHPDVLSLLIGTNDVDQWLKGDRSTAFDYDAWEAQYRALLAQLKSQNSKVQLVLGTPFVGTVASDYETRSAMVARLSTCVRAIATDLGAILVDYNSLFSTLTASQPNVRYWIWDGIHPSPAGHYKMFELWMQEAGDAIFATAQKPLSTELQTGGQFMDLLLPMEGSVAATESDWGTSAGENTQYDGTWEGTLGRWKDNGVEDNDRSYWGGNIIKGDDGKYHIYVSGWPESTARGHMAWSSASRVYHVQSDNVWGPYSYVSDIGAGHNSEIYKTGDTYVIYHIEPLGYYKSKTLGDTWESGEYTFDLRDRALIAGENRETSLSNCTFAKREDGSLVMMDRGGGIWVSRDGLTDPWHQITTSSVYLNSKVTNRGTLEDPVIWRDHLQYHMVVNDWKARYAYYYRSKDGLHWTMEDGKAYTGQDPFARHANGDVEKWHKYERPRVYQDELGRAVRMNFAVIDCVKQSDLGSDTHSSKNINMPLTRQLLTEVVDNSVITPSTTSIRVRIKAEDGFTPATDLNMTSLRFGSHDRVNYGNGFEYSTHEVQGSDIIVTFTGDEGESGITADEWAPKMLGQMSDGSIAFGYARLPYVDYQPAMLSAVTPLFGADGAVQSVSVTNYGQSAATATVVRIYAPNGSTLLAHGTTGNLAAYATETVTLTKDANCGTGYKTIVVRFYNGETLLNEETIALTTINAAQAALQTVISEAEALYADDRLTNGKDELKSAIDAAKVVAACYNEAALTAQQTTLNEALNTYKYANASPTNGLSITIPNAECNDLSEWTMTRLDADNAPGWKLNTTNRYGFDGNFIETYKGGGLKVANRACQTLTNLPAGRYRLRAKILATNNGSAATGVTFYAKGTTLTGSPVSQTVTTGNTAYTEYLLELTLTEAGDMEFGIDIASTTNATWVCFDSWSLKYFGTAEGDIRETERNTPILGINPQQVYHIKHLNTNRNLYLAAVPDASGHLLTTNTAADKGEYALLPVLGRQGYYYIYNTRGYFVTPSATYWTLSKTTPAAVLVTLNNTNQASLGTDSNIYLLGESAQHANPQVKDGVQLVYAYSAHETDKGNNWVLEAVSGATATLSLTSVTTDIESLVNSAAAEKLTLSYTTTVGSAGYGTIVVPFDADVQGDVETWVLTGIDGDNRILGNQVTTVEANKPVLLRNAGTLTLISHDGSVAYNDTPVNGLLTGVYSTTPAPASTYVLQTLNNATAFYQVSAADRPSVKPFRAYLTAPTQARSLTFAFDGVSTGVLSARDNALTVKEVYNIQGCRQSVSIQHRGISIVRMNDGSIKKIVKK